jgi:hypothetical protein
LPGKVNRGSRRRLNRIGLRRGGSWQLWVLIAWVVFLLLFVLPWVLRQGR